jgi:hypothetical protein
MMYNPKISYLNGVIFCLFLAFSCKNAEEPIPAYIRIEPFKVNADGGAAWQKLPDVWVYANTTFLGAYDLPHEVPVLAEGETDIQLFAGVKENGITSTPAPYFLMQAFEKKYTLRPGETTVVQPEVGYKFPEVKFAWDLDRTTLDNATAIIFDDRDTDGDLNHRLTTDSAFSNRCLIMPLTADHPGMIIASEPVELPTDGIKSAWLELHYLNDAPFVLSLVGSGNNAPESAPIPVFQFNVNPNRQWNKIYFNLTNLLANSRRERHRLYFRAEITKDASGKATQSKGSVRLDNIRLIHFK